ncbi:CPBP family intramembrane metalloprotease [Staphylococcus saprophyticus]|uniref:CPBP family intramembrane glutamic endopeptidase n=1 Tax=Staphylococcus xylosus TaxID=1288 RepID=UPI0010735C44|nr:type II CAAX endopeptidase family protein [Staphylococcus xylosus]MBF0812547.1 CPBP family intramembrane metalloprotease [Staphylococcus saprophyticus]TFV25498.1 CPBP family intramembrane metalloprotease [Staphylococcus saprophyticus]
MSLKNEKKYQWKDINGKDFFLPIIYLASNFILSIIILVILLAVNISFGGSYLDNGIDESSSTALLMEIGVFIFIMIIWMLLHKNSYKAEWKNGFNNIKKYWKLIVVTFIVMFIFKLIFPVLVDTFAPEQWKFEETQNDLLVQQMFSTPFSTVLAFFSIVIIAPVTEEFLFRHLVIGELGKKLNFIVMSVLSVIVFASLHVTEAQSPLEIVMYLVIAIGIVYIYLKTQRSLATAIALHALNNFIAYVAMVLL